MPGTQQALKWSSHRHCYHTIFPFFAISGKPPADEDPATPAESQELPSSSLTG